MVDYEGIGLAAPQVGKRIRLIVVGDPDTAEDDDEGIPLTVLFNPQFVAMSEESVSGWEGCLSIPEVRGVVPRSVEVTVSDRLGAPAEFSARDFFARVLQHEVDHLERNVIPRSNAEPRYADLSRGIPALLACGRVSGHTPYVLIPASIYSSSS